MSLDFGIANATAKCLQKMMICAGLNLRIALIDLMVYFIKEFMLDTPDDHSVAQMMQMLTQMIRFWH